MATAKKSKTKKDNGSKKMGFELFRYQLIPRSQQRLAILGETITVEELKERKNGYFMDELLGAGAYFDSIGNELFHKTIYHEGQNVVFQLGNAKQVILQDKNFNDTIAVTHPYVLVVVDNAPDIQIIAISINTVAFSNPFVVANILEKTFTARLDKYGLDISINPILDKKDFWDLIKKNEHRIAAMKFEIVKPNISNISSTLGEQLKGLVNSTNSQKTVVELTAPKGKVLENINSENESLNQVTEYATEGGASDVSLKIKGQRSYTKTRSTIRKTSIDEMEIKGSPDNIAKALGRILGLGI
jgi:hypothetical protein